MKQEHIKQIEVKAAVITVSTTRTPDTDTSGMTITTFLNAGGIPVQHYAIVPDKVEVIQAEVYRALKNANCVILNGGTGLTHDDCTIEAVSPLLEKKIDGFGELFRQKSFQEIGTATMLSRAIAGIMEGKAIFCIPGSTSAVTLATKELIIPEIVHILSHVTRH